MIALRYDPDLIEQAVFREVYRLEQGGNRRLAWRYRHERETAYDTADPDQRNDAFFAVHRKWFVELGLEDRLRAVLPRFPIITARAASLLLRKTLSRKDEGAELFVRTDARNVVVALRAERFAEPGALEPFLDHEFTHISDMLDDTFAYEPSLNSPATPPTELNLLRDRYRVLWDASIDGRLGIESARAARQAELDRAFSHWDDGRRRETFDRLWSGQRPTHPALLELARSGAATAPKLPGGPCPLCRFPTFDWADAGALASKTVERIRVHFPNWSPAHGVCGRCVEMYEATAMETPATLFLT